MISFRARRRQVVRQERRDLIRREVREQVALLARAEAGEPQAIRQLDENYRAFVSACPAAESERQQRRRISAIREGLRALPLSPRQLARYLVATLDRRRLREPVSSWSLSDRTGEGSPLTLGVKMTRALYAARSETWPDVAASEALVISP